MLNAHIAKKRRLEPDVPNKEVSSYLCCTVCMDAPGCNIFQCTSGHVICECCLETLCRNKYTPTGLEHLRKSECTIRVECPTCRLNTEFCRNLAVEQTIADLPTACQFCAMTLTRGTLQAHALTCASAPDVACSRCVEGCAWTGKPSDRAQHETACPIVRLCSQFDAHAEATSRLHSLGPDGDLSKKLLIEAIKAGHESVVKMLLRMRHEGDFVLDARTSERDYFLFLAVYSGQANVVSVLIEAGANPNKYFGEEIEKLDAYNDETGFTPLTLACACGHSGVVRVLLRAGADPDKIRTNAYSETPLTRAAAEGNSEIVQMLLRAGAKTDKTENRDQTPLFVAAQHGHLEITKALLTAGAAVDKPNEYGNTPLIEASRNDRAEVVVALLQAGAYVFRKNWVDQTALEISDATKSKKVHHILTNKINAIESFYKQKRDYESDSEV